MLYIFNKCDNITLSTRKCMRVGVEIILNVSYEIIGNNQRMYPHGLSLSVLVKSKTRNGTFLEQFGRRHSAHELLVRLASREYTSG